MTTNNIRVRFAPSPTGHLHIGGARTALYNFLLAKQMSGTFILRIEDTDLERSTPESIKAIIDGMQWLQLNWDEGPFYQTNRFPIYHQHIDKLLREKKAYPCFCTAEELDAKRKQAQAEKRKPMYDRNCLKMTETEVKEKIALQTPHCIRFKSPDTGETIVNDVVKGPVVVANKELDDLIIRRSDGSPTYNFVVVVDDVTMNITHVIRGDDHLNNTPRQIQLYEAFGYPSPVFAHVPMILGADKQRLSKRHGATSVMSYKDMGYLPEALINYLVRLGWSYQDQEIFTTSELIEKFNLEHVSKSAGIFNPEKLLWLNGIHIRQTSAEVLAEQTIPFLQKKGIVDFDRPVMIKAIEASKEKVKTLIELADLIDFLYLEIQPEEKLIQKFFTPDIKPIVGQTANSLFEIKDWSHENIAQVFNNKVAETGLGLGKIAQPFRVALTGRSISPGVFDVIYLLGKETSLKRIHRYL